jgi:hypothetical protein
MLKRIFLVVAGVVGFFVLAVIVVLWDTQDSWFLRRPDIKFAPLADTAIKDPDNPTKLFRVDMAQVEQEYPLGRADLAKLKPEHIRALAQEEIDQIYGRITAGPIPDGVYFGDLVFPRADSANESYATQAQLIARRFRHMIAPFVPFVRAGAPPRLEEALGGAEGLAAGAKVDLLESVGRSIWKGKFFYRDRRMLRNFIEDFKVVEHIIKIDDKNAVEKIRIARQGQLLPFLLPTTSVNLLFPAKLHCGQSLIDGRREAILLDYAFNDELPGYQANPDGLVGRNGLHVLDEMRMIRPGFYLGRGYINRIFVLNFTLYSPKVADAGLDGFARGGPISEDCWAGEQLRHATAN